MSFKRVLLFGLLILGASSWLTGVALAVTGTVATDIGSQLQAAAGQNGAALGAPMDPRLTVVLIIRVLLGLTAIVLVILNLYAGVMWMTAGGNEEQVTKAQTTLRNAVIGLVIVLSAYAITIFVTSLAQGYSTGGGGGILGSFIPFL